MIKIIDEMPMVGKRYLLLLGDKIVCTCAANMSPKFKVAYFASIGPMDTFHGWLAVDEVQVVECIGDVELGEHGPK